MLKILELLRSQKSRILSVFDNFHLVLILIVFMILSINFPIFWVVFTLILFLILYKKAANKCLVGATLIFLAAIYLIYMYNVSQIKDNISDIAEVIDVLKKETYYINTFRINGLNYINYTNKELYEIGQKLFIKGRIEAFETNTFPGGFNQFKYYLSLNINGKLVIESDELLNVNFLRNYFTIWTKNYINNYANISFRYVDSFLFSNRAFSTEIKETYMNFSIYSTLGLTSVILRFFELILKKVFFLLNVSYIKQRVIIVNIFFLVLLITNFKMVALYFFLKLLYQLLNELMDLRFNQLDILCFVVITMLFLNIHYVYNTAFILIICFSTIRHLFKGKLKPFGFVLTLIISNILFGYNNIYQYLIYMIQTLVLNYLIYPVSFLALLGNGFLLLSDRILEVYENLILKLNEVNILDLNYNIGRFNQYLVLIACAFSVLITLYFIREKARKCNRNKIPLLSIAFYCAILMINNLILSNYNEGVYFIDTGQGDSNVIIYEQKTIVIDCFYNIDSSLKVLGVNKIDYLILTHSDYDHIREANILLTNYNVKNLIINGYSAYNLNIRKALQLIVINKPQTIDISEKFYLDFISPTQKYSKNNDNSLVFLTEIFGEKFMFTGDIERNAENEIIKNYTEKQIDIDILKVAHHGSKTSTQEDFIQITTPKVAIISCAQNNHYGMPDIKLLEMLKNYNVKVYITYMNGTIIIKRKNKQISYQTKQDYQDFMIKYS